jgi:uncharacterized protein (TIGR03435 family)
MTTEDMELVREYARHGSEEAFATLVSRHVNLVYSVALRQIRDPHLAEEVAQVTFIILARKAESLGPKTILAAWLCRTAHYAVADALRSQRRRQNREQEGYMQSLLNQSEPDLPAWTSIAPLLDSALAELREKDHSAIVLRFFEGRNLKEVGAALGVSENAANKRVNRALEKLRRYFSNCGVNSTTAIIAGTISAHSVQAAPMALAKSITAMAMTKGVTASGSTLTLIKGALKIMAWTKLKVATVVGVAALVGVGTATVTVHAVSHYRAQAREAAAWAAIGQLVDVVTDARKSLSPSDIQHVQSLSNVVSIRRTQFASQIDDGLLQNAEANILLGIAMPAGGLLGHAYGVSRTRLVNPEALPPGKYDFVVNLPNKRMEALQTAIKKEFGLVGRHEMRETNVLTLTKVTTNVPGLKPGTKRDSKTERYFGTGIQSNGRVKYRNRKIGDIALLLEHHLGIPVVNETDLAGLYNFELEADSDVQTPDLQAVNQSLLDQLGLQLSPATQTVEMLVVKRVN